MPLEWLNMIWERKLMHYPWGLRHPGSIETVSEVEKPELVCATREGWTRFLVVLPNFDSMESDRKLINSLVAMPDLGTPVKASRNGLLKINLSIDVATVPKYVKIKSNQIKSNKKTVETLEGVMFVTC